MKKYILLIGLFTAISAVTFAQIPPNWDTSPPQDTAAIKYAVGVSQPSTTEQDALRNAMQDAVQQFASAISTQFQSRTDITVQSQYFSSDIEDAYTFRLETSSFTTNVPITGVREAARKVERSGGYYIARVLAVISVEDYNRARQYILNEEASYLAYIFFSQRGLFSSTGSSLPSGYSDYYSWLRNNCVIITIDDTNQNALIEQVELYVKKVYNNAVFFAQIIDGRSARIIYNSGVYYDGILRSLQTIALFSIQVQSSHIILRPLRANILAELRTAVNNAKDSTKFVITGLETIQTQSGNSVNQSLIVINQFKTIASRQFNMQAVNYNIPAQYLSGNIDEEGIIRYVQNNQAAFPARYLVICRSETRLQMGNPAYNIPPHINASCYFLLYDIVTGQTIHSETAETATPSFQPSNLNDRTVIEEGRRALQFLYSASNQPGLIDIMRGVFERL
jgi:hypothetical protein